LPKFIARIRAKPGQGQHVAQALKELVAPSRAEEGCLLYDVCRSVDDATELLVLEEWESQAALDAHMRTPHFVAFLEKVGEAIEGAPRLEMIERM
jgi:quinol monooxygenase YgiN